uniref:Putative secreted protein n=1 Tax=Anopheles triannulatus TaxID=58253 RepID=A0A2M4B5G6_9DIPT
MMLSASFLSPVCGMAATSTIAESTIRQIRSSTPEVFAPPSSTSSTFAFFSLFSSRDPVLLSFSDWPLTGSNLRSRCKRSRKRPNDCNRHICTGRVFSFKHWTHFSTNSC